MQDKERSFKVVGQNPVQPFCLHNGPLNEWNDFWRAYTKKYPVSLFLKHTLNSYDPRCTVISTSAMEVKGRCTRTIAKKVSILLMVSEMLPSKSDAPLTESEYH